MTSNLGDLFQQAFLDDTDALHDSSNVDDGGEFHVSSTQDINPHVQFDDEFHLTIGDADLDDRWWNWQGDQNSCAVVAQQGVLESILGHYVPQEDIIREAEANGWYDPSDGTPPASVGNILEAHGISVDRGFDHSITDLYDALARGDKVIVGLNANEIRYPQRDRSGTPLKLPEAGHAVWVTGIEEAPGEEAHVILNDSAPITGRHSSIALSDFLNAWEDYGNYAVIAHPPALI